MFGRKTETAAAAVNANLSRSVKAAAKARQDMQRRDDNPPPKNR